MEVNHGVMGNCGGSVGVLRGVWIPDSGFNGSWDNTGTSDCFNFPLNFEAGTILAFLFCYIALIVNELGSIQAVGHMLQADQMGQRTTRGVGIVGVTNVLSGLFGVIGPVDYSMSPGVISATGCASRYTLLPAGAGLILCAFSLLLWECW